MIVDNLLTPEETTRIYSWYNTSVSDKLFLKPLNHISDNDILMACYARESFPFGNCTKKDWVIERENDIAKVSSRKSQYTYQLNLTNGNVHLFNQGKPSKLGEQVFVVQFLYGCRYALPCYFCPTHPANGKTPLDLGIAVPDTTLLDDLLKHKYNRDVRAIQDWYFDIKLNEVNLDDISVYNQVINDLCQEIGVDMSKIL